MIQNLNKYFIRYWLDECIILNAFIANNNTLNIFLIERKVWNNDVKKSTDDTGVYKLKTDWNLIVHFKILKKLII